MADLKKVWEMVKRHRAAGVSPQQRKRASTPLGSLASSESEADEGLGTLGSIKSKRQEREAFRNAFLRERGDEITDEEFEAASDLEELATDEQVVADLTEQALALGVNEEAVEAAHEKDTEGATALLNDLIRKAQDGESARRAVRVMMRKWREGTSPRQLRAVSPSSPKPGHAASCLEDKIEEANGGGAEKNSRRAIQLALKHHREGRSPRQQRRQSSAQSGLVEEGYPKTSGSPCQTAETTEREPPKAVFVPKHPIGERKISARLVPLTFGLAALGGAVGAMLGLGGVAGVLIGGMFLAFAVSSLKTAFSASSKEIEELTGGKSASEDTKERLRRRI